MRRYGMVLTLIAALACSSGTKNQQYRTEKVDRGDVTQTVTATGTLSAVITVAVGSQVSGVISRLYVDFNSPVKKDELLAEIDPTPFQAQVEQQRANLQKAKVDAANYKISFDRQARLLTAGLAAQADYDSAKAQYDGAIAVVQQTTASLVQAETNLKYTKIVSPIDGVVVDREYDVGQTVAASFQAPLIFSIAQDLTKMQVQADVDQSDIGSVQVGQTARFTVDAYPDQEFRGTISQVRLNATVSQNVVTYPVMISVPNPDEKLRPKMTANVTIDVAQVHDVLRIPNAALRFKPETGATPQTGTAGARGQGTATGTGTAPGGAAAGGGPSPEQRLAQLGQRRPGISGAATAFGSRAPRARPQTVWILGPNNQLTSFSINTGITDGHYTAVVGGKLQPGQNVVIGLATSKVEGPPPPGSQRGPMGGGGRGR